VSAPAEIAGTPRAPTRWPRAWRLLLALAAVAVSIELSARVLAPEPSLGILVQRPLVGLYPGLDRPDEVFSELAHSCLQWSPYEHWTMQPNLRRRFFRTNSLGLRGPETPRVKPPRRFRIAVLGGSSAWGVGSTADERTVPGQIEARLRELLPGIDVEVLNAAQPGFVSAQELIHFHRSIASLDPDLVVLFDGYNDVVADLGNPVPGWPQGAQHLQMRYEDFLRSGRFGADLLLFLRSSRAFDVAFSRLATPPLAVPPPSVPVEETARCYVRNAVALERLVAPRAVWVALQPVLATTRKPLAPEEQGVLADRERQTPGYAARVRGTYGAVTKDLPDTVPSIDLDEVLGGEPRPLFVDDCHFADEAARLIGRRIAEGLNDAHAILTPP
jgi:lysophospholipase L1-like esterase